MIKRLLEKLPGKSVSRRIKSGTNIDIKKIAIMETVICMKRNLK